MYQMGKICSLKIPSQVLAKKWTTTVRNIKCPATLEDNLAKSCTCKQLFFIAPQFYFSAYTLYKNSCTRALKELSKNVHKSIVCANNTLKTLTFTKRRMDKSKI